MSKLPLNLPDLKKNKTLVIVLIAVLLIMLIICIVIWLPYLIDKIRNDDDTTSEDAPKVTTCEDLLGKALEASDDSCQTIGSNEICYGNFNVSVVLADDSLAQFESLGDTIPVSQLVNLNTDPMDTLRDIWGIAVFKLLANMPGTIPGQNVTFLVFGDTGLYNFSGDMYSIYFSTGIGSVTCSQVPDGLMVDVPEGGGVVFTANGVDLALEGDSVLTANPGGNMTVTMLNGTGVVTSEGQSQDISAGQMLTIPISDTLEAQGAPSNPIDMPPDVALELCLLTGGDCDTGWIQTVTPGGSDMGPPTNTPVPVEPGMPTNTSVPLATTQTSTPSTPTDTLAPGVTPPTSTNTPTATNTSTPTHTATNTPTNTPTPTDTPPASCDAITLSNYTADGNTVSLTITNNNASPVVFTGLHLAWNEGTNGLLDEIRTNSNKIIWGPGKDPANSPADIPENDMPPAPHRTINGGGGERILEFIFENNGAVLPTSLTVDFDIGCSK